MGEVFSSFMGLRDVIGVGEEEGHIPGSYLENKGMDFPSKTACAVGIHFQLSVPLYGSDMQEEGKQKPPKDGIDSSCYT